MDHMLVFQVVTASDATMTQLNHLSSEKGDGDIFQDLGSIFGKAITTISKIDSVLIETVGHGALQMLLFLLKVLLFIKLKRELDNSLVIVFVV